MLTKNELDEKICQNDTPDNRGHAAPTGLQAELCDLWQPDELMAPPLQADFEDILCQVASVSNEQLEQARAVRRNTPRKRLGEILLEMNAVSEQDLLRCIAQQYELEFVHVQRDTVDPDALARLDRAFIEAHRIIPLRQEAGRLVVATADPTDVFLLDEVKRNTGMELIVQVCTAEDIHAVLNTINEPDTDFHVDEIIADVNEDDLEVVKSEEEDIEDLERGAAESPIIKFVNYVIHNAVKEGASDIHIEPGDNKLKIRYRIDGVLFESMAPPHNMHAPVISRIKIMDNLDIAERRLPQDGRIRVIVRKRKIDMRVSTLPTSHGEKVVIRLLDTGAMNLTLTDLGMEEETSAILDHQIKQPHGIVLVTGPTGSGKSTTLYAALQTMDAQHLNISTVEDPVEYHLDGVAQVQVHERIGMTFGAALRSLLRQDPDVIMVGEIRDEETARIAIQASLTGHLVLSTLHTNDAPSSITRLINIGVESYLIAAATNGVLAQRLVRRICSKCKTPAQPRPDEAHFLEMYGFTADNMFKGAGCDACRHTGYQGRLGIYELLALDDTYRDIITKSPTVTELRRLCKERGMVTLREDGFRKVRAGLTTIDEVMRVTEATM